MFGALLLFEDEFIHVVAISYTALILTELTMVTSTLIILIMTWPTLSSSGGSDHPYLAPSHGPGRAPLHSPLPSLTDSAQRILWYNVVLCKKLAISYFYRFTKTVPCRRRIHQVCGLCVEDRSDHRSLLSSPLLHQVLEETFLSSILSEVAMRRMFSNASWDNFTYTHTGLL